MQITVHQSPLQPPLLDTKEARTLEVRDEDTGRLCGVMLFPPGKQTFIFMNQTEPGFAAFVKELGFKP